jgi:hypothetical protein
MPDAGCAQHAIAAMDQVWRVESRDNALGVFLKWPGHSDAELAALDAKLDAESKKAGGRGYTHFPEITVRFLQAADGPRFSMMYRGWLKPDDYREVAAHAIVGQIASACHMPTLAQRATEKRDSSAAPYLFGI